MSNYKHILLILFIIGTFKEINAADFIFGNDLSYVNQMEDCGAVYKENGIKKDPFTIFADHGTNLVRVRLWVDPSWWQSPLKQPDGVKSYYNDIVDVKKTIARAKSAGMQVMLGIHYSDTWADPGRQLIPRRWLEAAKDSATLTDSVYAYTFKLLADLESEKLMPNIVKVGNETNLGILNQIPQDDGIEAQSTISYNWRRHAKLFNAAIRAIRDISKISTIKPKIALHFSNSLASQQYNYSTIIKAGVTDFDIIGFSYYYAWHGGSISELETTIRELKSTFPSYEVMVVETGYLWTQKNADSSGNIINTPDPEYYPVIPEKQLEYMVDFTKAVMNGGGTGVIFWEPAWVSTPCSTPWNVGSSHDHVAFFEPHTNNFISNGGGCWTESRFYTNPTYKKATFKVDMTDQPVDKDVYILGTWMGKDAYPVKMINLGDNIYSYHTYLPKNSTGGYFFLNDTTISSHEIVPTACALWADTMRMYHVNHKAIENHYQWQACTNNLTNVTFNVDIKGFSLNHDEFVYLHGSFNNWNPIPLTLTTDSIYTITIPLKKDDSIAYHYSMGPTWKYPKAEALPDYCFENTTKEKRHRTLKTTNSDITIINQYGTCNKTASHK